MKKKLPLDVLKVLEQYVDFKNELFEVIPPDNFLLKIKDTDKDSDFFFYIEEYQIDAGNAKFLLTRKPASSLNIDTASNWYIQGAVNAIFKEWANTLQGYNTVKTFYDDPILDSFTEEYFAEFEIVDEDADVKPFSTKQILFLDSYLQNIEETIEKFKTEENATQIAEIKKDAAELREELTNSPKKKVIKKLSKIWAKIAKQGTKFIKEFLSEARKEFIKEGIKEGFKWIMENGHNLIQ